MVTMGAWSRASCASVTILSLAVSCSGDEFDSSGSGGSSGTGGADAGGGSAGSASNCGSAGAPPSDAATCSNELYCRTCNQVTTGSASCDECARSRCCESALECMGDLACAQLLACYFNNCRNLSATNCIFDSCGSCTQNIGEFTFGIAACIQNNCKGKDGTTDPCPQLVP